ncbi:helix-turn-helix domain-containing protein [Ralstonia pseudosolanacearum]
MKAGLHTIDLQTAAKLLGAHPETVRLKAKAGMIPGRKVGKRWVFSIAALERYLAGEWTPQASQSMSVEANEPGRSSAASTASVHASRSTPLEAERRYREALASTAVRKRTVKAGRP